MYSQVLNFAIDPDHKGKVEELIETWAKGPGKSLPGCDKITVAQEVGGLSRIAVIAHFKDQSSLDHFSKDEDSLKLFDTAKSFVKGKPSYYEATIKNIDLS